MPISRSYSFDSVEAVIEDNNGEYWKRNISILIKRKKINQMIPSKLIRDKNKIGRYLKNHYGVIPNNELSKYMKEQYKREKKYKYIISKINNIVMAKVFENWVKKTKHIRFSEGTNIKTYSVEGFKKRMKDRKNKKNKKKDDDCYIVKVVTNSDREKISKEQAINLL